MRKDKLKPKLLMLGLIITMLWSSIGNADWENSSQIGEKTRVPRYSYFYDINDHWAYSYIAAMVDAEVLNGYEDGNFRPDWTVTRAEFATMLVKSGTFDRSGYRGEFYDVNSADWHSTYVQTAYDKGWMNGYSDGTFAPDAPITRLEMAAIIGRIVGPYTGSTTVGEDMINNVFWDGYEIPEWAYKDVAYVLETGIMQGVNDYQFLPYYYTTRAEAATVLYKTLAFYNSVGL